MLPALLRPACRSSKPWAASRHALARLEARGYSKTHLKRMPPPPKLPRIPSAPRPLEYSAPTKKAAASATSQSATEAQSLASIPRHRRIVLLVGGALLAIPVLYVSFLATSLINAKPHAANVPADTSYMYNRNASSFDADVGAMETTIGLTRLRAELCKQARGHVLESAAGTGRNTTAYPLMGGRIKSVTMVDQSREMIDVARVKWPEQGNAWFIHTLFRVADLSSSGAASSIKPPAKSKQLVFDTVVQTMGLCSTGEPVKLLQNLGRLCVPDDGRILLLEHGRSHYAWLDALLDRAAPAHAERHGCWWNKDIGAIVDASGLEVVEQRRHHLGTTWWYVLKAPAGYGRSLEAAEEASTATAQPSEMLTPSPWWRFWQT